MRIIKYNIIILILFFLPAACLAKTISGKDARRYLGDLKSALTARPYWAVVLERRDPHPLNGNKIDAILFNSRSSEYHFIRRLSDDYRLKLNAPGGREAPVVSADNFSSYAKIIKDNSLTPYVILDKTGMAGVIIYCGLQPCYIEYKELKDGSSLIDVRATFLPDMEPDRPLRKYMRWY